MSRMETFSSILQTEPAMFFMGGVSIVFLLGFDLWYSFSIPNAERLE